MRFIQPTPEGISNYEKLLDALIEKVEYHKAKIWDRWSPHLNLADGTTWLLNLSHASNDVLFPHIGSTPHTPPP
ncbi:MAG: hypothetical protein NZM04_04045 [Methylacidiphilales bacterium]|nr:hypothetical protein [Candidatus Methylacidiphilales bacterium]